MAAESGHAANRIYGAQDGSFHLNGAAFYNDAEVDISSNLETALAGSSAGMKMDGGQTQNSSLALNTINTSLSGIVAAWASVKSSATLSTAAGIAAFCTVAFSTNSSALQVLAHRNAATANEVVQATSTTSIIVWGALGYS